MVDVRPFRGLRYDAGRVGDLADVLCPPYDVISPTLQRALYERSPYNVVRLEYGRAFPEDDERENPYTRAAAQLRRWRQEGVLARDPRPAFYLIEERFPWRGGTATRHTLMSCVRLEPWERGIVLPHEQTRSAPKEDRFRLMKATAANISPVMGLYEDPTSEVGRVVTQTLQRPPDVSTRPVDGESYRLWVVDAPQDTEAIRRALAEQPLYIADGHHRYETALRYHREQPRSSDEDAAHRFVMTALVGMADPGLLLLPYHRVVSGLEGAELARLGERLGELFTTEWAEVDGLDAAAAARALMERVESAQVVAMAVVGLEEGKALVCTRAPGQGGPLPQAEVQGLEECDSWVLQYGVLDPAAGEGLAQGRVRVEYYHDAAEAAGEVAEERAQVAFLLRPLPLEVFQRVVRQGYRLPPKSTFFYPKLPTGLVLNPLEGDL